MKIEIILKLKKMSYMQNPVRTVVVDGKRWNGILDQLNKGILFNFVLSTNFYRVLL